MRYTELTRGMATLMVEMSVGWKVGNTKEFSYKVGDRIWDFILTKEAEDGNIYSYLLYGNSNNSIDVFCKPYSTVEEALLTVINCRIGGIARDQYYQSLEEWISEAGD